MQYMQGMQLSGLACRVTSCQSWKEDCMTEMHLLCIYVRGFQLDNGHFKGLISKLEYQFVLETGIENLGFETQV